MCHSGPHKIFLAGALRLWLLVIVSWILRILLLPCPKNLTAIHTTNEQLQPHSVTTIDYESMVMAPSYIIQY